MIIQKNNDYVTIVIPEGKTALIDGIEVPISNWTCTIPINNTQALSKYLTQEQINQLQGE
jgi:hypothetical protein